MDRLIAGEHSYDDCISSVSFLKKYFVSSDAEVAATLPLCIFPLLVSYVLYLFSRNKQRNFKFVLPGEQTHF